MIPTKTYLAALALAGPLAFLVLAAEAAFDFWGTKGRF